MVLSVDSKSESVLELFNFCTTLLVIVLLTKISSPKNRSAPLILYGCSTLEPKNEFIEISLPLYVPSSAIGLISTAEPENRYCPFIEVFAKFFK